MKTNRIAKKLSFNKITINTLTQHHMDQVQGGVVTGLPYCGETEYGCPSYPPLCTKRPKPLCVW